MKRTNSKYYKEIIRKFLDNQHNYNYFELFKYKLKWIKFFIVLFIRKYELIKNYFNWNKINDLNFESKIIFVNSLSIVINGIIQIIFTELKILNLGNTNKTKITA